MLKSGWKQSAPTMWPSAAGSWKDFRPFPAWQLKGPKDPARRVGVFSLDFAGRDNAEVAYTLETQFGILTRCGLHCAPAAHKTLGTFPRGTVRFSTGWFTSEADIDAALAAIRAVTAE